LKFAPGSEGHHFDVRLEMKKTLKLFTVLLGLLPSSCANMDDIGLKFTGFNFSSSSRYDREIDSDTDRMLDDKPLKHFSAEKRLRAARENRLLDEMMYD